MLRLIATALFLLLSLSGCSHHQSSTYTALDYSPSYHRTSSSKSFDAVLEDLLFAISNENYNITSINQVGKAIAKRHDIAFPRYTIVNSCNLEIAKQFLDIDPSFVTVMPCWFKLESAQFSWIFIATLKSISITISCILSELTTFMFSIFMEMYIAKIHFCRRRCSIKCSRVITCYWINITQGLWTESFTSCVYCKRFSLFRYDLIRHCLIHIMAVPFCTSVHW